MQYYNNNIRGSTRSENARDLLVWVYRELCVYILYAFWAQYTQYLCWFFAPQKLLIIRHNTMPRAHQSKRRACVRVKTSRMCVEDLTVICIWTQKKRLEFQLGRFVLKAPSNYITLYDSTFNSLLTGLPYHVSFLSPSLSNFVPSPAMK